LRANGVQARTLVGERTQEQEEINNTKAERRISFNGKGELRKPVSTS